MQSYRCYLIDSTGHVATARLLHCELDSQVHARADELLAAAYDSGIEVWDGSRQVYRAHKPRWPGKS
jgi:hypothetical protein